MIFLYNEEASKELLTIKGEQHKYLAKVRRHEIGDVIGMRSKAQPHILYHYKIIAIEPRALQLQLMQSEVAEVLPQKKLHIGWCVIDNKSIEKVLASLNEIGVTKITFIYCDRSQKNFKPDFKRFKRILEASNQQCGRSDFMEFAICKNIESFIEQNPDTKVFDFTDQTLECESDFQTVLIGCEGGFSPQEKEFLKNQEVFRLNTSMVLRSESAVLAVASKIIL